MESNQDTLIQENLEGDTSKMSFLQKKCLLFLLSAARPEQSFH